jgi:cobalt-zinc-cadmium efflux system outer membrane protein
MWSLILAASVAVAQPSPIDLSASLDDAALASLLWERSPELVEARARLGADAAEALKAKLFPNPELDLGVGTLPMGQRNPPGEIAYWDVPNYGVQVSELVEIGKRGPRQRATAASYDATVLETRELLRQRLFDLCSAIGDIAVTQVRVGVLEGLAKDAAELRRVESGRVEHGESAGLNVDRALVEEEKAKSDLAEEQEKLQRALLGCLRVAGAMCLPFKDGAQAQAFLTQRSQLAAPTGIESRPDVKALDAREQSASASMALAAAKKLPDVTLRAGYLYDRFIVSGNQRHSFNVGISLPLPLFDRGQAEAVQAGAAGEAAALAKQQLLSRVALDVSHLSEQLKSVLTRRQRMNEQTIPVARQVVDRLAQAVERGGATLPELLLARRTLGELLVSAADLEGTAYQLAVSLRRSAGEEPAVPAALAKR